MVLNKEEADGNEVLMNFKVPSEFYQLYKEASQKTQKTMKTILIESFHMWYLKNQGGIQNERV